MTSPGQMSPYAGGGTPDTSHVPWRALLTRLFVLVVPGQLVGGWLGVRLLLNASFVSSHPELINLVVLLSGGLPGLLVGLLVSPRRGRLPTYLATCAASAVVAWFLLQGVAAVGRSPDVPAPRSSVYLVGPVANAAAQTGVAALLWAVRARRD